MSDFDALSQRYEKALDAQRDSRAILGRARARFAERLHGVEAAPAASRWRIAIPALVAVGVAVAVGVVVRPEAPLDVTVRGQAGRSADFVQAPEGAEEVLDFSDGSEVRVRAASQLRVLGVTSKGAHVALERGAAHVAVVHREQTKWLFSAGPYRVHVIGTRFELRWSPEAGGLEVEMDEGIVEVDGPGLVRQRVTGRQKLEAFAEPASASLYLAPPEETEAPEAEVAAAEAPTRRRVQRERPVAPQKPRYTGPSWRYLADKGDAFGAMSAAEQADFGWLVTSMPGPDVLLLGDVALKTKQPERAREAWLAVRERFRGSPAAVQAALRLGRLAASQERDDKAAALWFARAAREAPNADTAPEALGEWLTVLARSGRPADVKAVATEYLRRFRNGPHAAQAREALGAGSAPVP